MDFDEIETISGEMLGADGGSSIDSDIEECGATVLNLGIFFDGTHNNEHNVQEGFAARTEGDEPGGSRG